MSALDTDHCSDNDIRELARVLLPDARVRRDINLVQGIVASIQYDNTLSVYLGGETTLSVNNIRYLSSYVPVVGDVIQLVKNGADLFVVGKIKSVLPTSGSWQVPALLNGFTNFGSGYEPARYWITPDGWVHLGGVLARAGGASILPIFTLPVGYRPATKQRLIAFGATGPMYGINIDTNGDVNVASYTVGANFTYFSLNGCAFPAAPYSDSLWTPLGRSSSWVQATAFEGGWQGVPRAFRRDDGWVCLDGVMSGGVIANTTIAYLLPDDHRLKQDQIFVVSNYNGANQVANRLDADISYLGPWVGSNNLMSLGGLHWFDKTRESDWTTVALLNAWVAYSAYFPVAGCLLDKFGVVHCRGLIKSGAVPSIAFNLPIGMRPLYPIITIAQSNSNAGRIDILPDGNVTISAPSNNTFVDLGQIMFRAEL